jgi:uncharacterized membrane protein
LKYERELSQNICTNIISHPLSMWFKVRRRTSFASHKSLSYSIWIIHMIFNNLLHISSGFTKLVTTMLHYTKCGFTHSKYHHTFTTFGTLFFLISHIDLNVEVSHLFCWSIFSHRKPTSTVSENYLYHIGEHLLRAFSWFWCTPNHLVS